MTPVKLQLQTALSPTECRARIAAVTDPLGSWRSSFGTRPFLSSFTDDRMHIQRRKRIRNDFAPTFSGRIQPSTAGSRITGSFAPTLERRWFFWIWGSVSVIACLATQSFAPFQWSLAILGVAVFVAMSGTPDRDAIRAFLITTLEVHDLEPTQERNRVQQHPR